MSQNSKNTDQKYPQLPGGWIGIAFGVLALVLIFSVFGYQNDIHRKNDHLQRNQDNDPRWGHYFGCLGRAFNNSGCWRSQYRGRKDVIVQ